MSRAKIIAQLLQEARTEGMLAERDYMIEELWHLWAGGRKETTLEFMYRIEERFPSSGRGAK